MPTHKVVYNSNYGGFGLSDLAISRLRELLPDANLYSAYECTRYFADKRHHPVLVSLVQDLGAEASDPLSELSIKEIDSDRYIIKEYDGLETVVTPSDITWIKI